MYAMLGTRPDLAFSVSVVSRYASNPNPRHWQAVKRIFRYIRGTLSLQLTYRGKLSNLEGYTDADCAGDYDTRRSTSGYIFNVGNGAISWSSKRQPTVALSSCKAEYMGQTQPQKKQCGWNCYYKNSTLIVQLTLLDTRLHTPQYTPSLFTVIIRALSHLENPLRRMLEANILIFSGTINEKRLRMEQWSFGTISQISKLRTALPNRCQKTNSWHFEMLLAWNNSQTRSTNNGGAKSRARQEAYFDP